MKTWSWNAEAMAAHDYALCQRFHRLSALPVTCGLFQVVSRLGDRAIWYAIILSLPLFLGENALRVSAVLTLATLSGVMIYGRIKARFRRLRPFHRHPDIRAAALALDEFSFPSGHTLHATSFTVILLATIPVLGWLFLPFAVLTALSRVILGLHYPSDVGFGAVVGLALGLSALEVGYLLGALPLP